MLFLSFSAVKGTIGSNSDITQYLVGNPQLNFHPVKVLDPVTYPPTELEQPDHECVTLTNELFASQPKL